MNQFPTNQFPTNLFPPWKDLESLRGHCSHQGAEDAVVYLLFSWKMNGVISSSHWEVWTMGVGAKGWGLPGFKITHTTLIQAWKTSAPALDVRAAGPVTT